MKVILLQTIDKLGKAGEVLAVKEGYARNYLIPKNLAKEATAGNMKMMNSLKKKQAEEDAKKLAEIKTVAEKFAYEKKLMIKELAKYNIQSILTSPQNLTITTVNRYLEIKARQMI